MKNIIEDIKKIDIKNCPVRRTMPILFTKWAMLIIMNLNETRRYGEIKKLIPDISEKILISKLKLLEVNGFIKRKNYGEIPLRVDYSLTALGKSTLDLVPILAKIGNKMTK